MNIELRSHESRWKIDKLTAGKKTVDVVRESTINSSRRGSELKNRHSAGVLSLEMELTQRQLSESRSRGQSRSLPFGDDAPNPSASVAPSVLLGRPGHPVWAECTLFLAADPL
jgi:hypothetical protein